eukprot:CAMPEP_0178431108 /NCGR_PEP_ID=MMETSP0689_2-20121128/31668_1 /TAXON_ID=160604 /ORGANISM="Amphidinium massartii, Strain CS-259" /LENGTH=294 /DNA_ID=CAMNT_0020052991 /DNA_START=65 /DNA_END=945 /DNA_ORIENTATION=-
MTHPTEDMGGTRAIDPIETSATKRMDIPHSDKETKLDNNNAGADGVHVENADVVQAGTPMDPVEGLEKVIEEHGIRRDAERTKSIKDFHAKNQDGSSAPSFAADLILQQEDGFEVWIGSLDDALCLEALSKVGINAILNAATQDCFAECASFRRGCGRRTRVHARGISAMHETQSSGGGAGSNSDSDAELAMSFEQVRERATFDGDWYSQIMNRDIKYLGLEAEDVAEYDITKHFEESIQFMDDCRRERRKVLVHCLMGINRSAALLVAYLCSPGIGLGIPLREALALVAGLRG